MAAVPSLTSPQEYLRAEREANVRHELINGRVVAMAGATKEHVAIVANLVVELSVGLRPQGCRPYPTDLRVRVRETDLYTYPDISVICGKGTFDEDDVDVLLDPVGIVEVLSKSTEAYDRGAKFAHYRRIPELHTYVLVSSTSPLVDVFERQDDGAWSLVSYEGLDGTIRLGHLNVEVVMRDVYRDVDFEGDDLAPAPS